MRTPTLRSVGELGFLRRLLPQLAGGPGVIVGPGDDCAVVRAAPRTLLTVDALVEGQHFERHWQTAAQLGAKAVTVNLSDIAAMGGRPQYCLMSIGAPPDYPLRDLQAIHRGAARAARAAGARVVGGNVSAAARLFLSVTVAGAAPRRPALRRGAQPGEFIFVTGTLGDAAAAVRLLQARIANGRDAAALLRRLVAPTARLAAGARLAAVASAMIDVSDGLVQDLGHICNASAVGAVVLETRLPLSPAYRAVIGDDPALALSGGEDYELLFTVPARRLPLLEKLRPRLGCPLTFIGETVTRPRAVRLQDRAGRLRAPRRGGYDHFRVG